MGKSERGAVWLTADRTSPYAFYQYWINVADDDAGLFLRLFTLLEREAVDELLESHSRAPHERAAQRVLARELTERLHGSSERARVEAASDALFGRGELETLDEATLGEVFADVPHSEHALDALSGEGAALVELLPRTSLAGSKREAREFLERGAVAVNGRRADKDRRLTAADLLPGRLILLRRGKKQWHATRWL
jgi:tyrosyl-tRNA synthetase